MTKNADLKNFRRLAGFKIYCLIIFLAICLTAGASSFAASIGDLKQDISGGEAVSTQQTSSSSALDDSAKAAAEDKYEMALLADLHICESNLKAVTQAINAANGFGVNATAILGDSCKEIATEKEFDIAVKTIRKLKSKIFAVTGNHDCIYEDHKTAEGKKIRAGASVKKRKLERFNEAFGQKSNYFAHKANGYLLVFLSADALDAKHLVTLSAHSLKWLENTLSKNKNMPTIIFCHAPLENTFKASEKLGMANSSVQPADKVEDILKSNKQVFMWASGHAHIRTSNKHFASSANIWKNQVHAVHNGNINNDARCFNMLTLTSKYVLVRTYDAKNDKWLKKFDRKIGHDGKLIAADGKIEDEEKDEPQKDGDDEDEDKNEDGPDGAADNDNKDDNKKEPEDLKGIVTPGLGEVKVRDGAWGKVIGTLFSGKFVDIKSVEGDWYIIDYNGKKGYILKQAMLTNSGDDSKLKKMETTATVNVDPAYGLNVRDGAWGDKIGKLDDGDKIEITGVEGDWYKIKFKGKTGFVYKAYVDVNKAGEKRIAGAEDKPAAPAKQTVADNKTGDAADGKKADNSSQPAAGTKGFEKGGLLNAAVSSLKQSEAAYIQIVGEVPKGIKQPSAAKKAMPNSLDNAVATGMRENPNIIAAMRGVDAAGFNVKEAEGAMLPGVSLQGSVYKSVNTVDGPGDSLQGTVSARLTVPIYQGGAEYGQIRQAKERLGESQLQVDSARMEVQRTIASAHAQYEAANASIAAIRVQIDAANQALNGVIEERNVGQRTTLDVLNAQQNVLEAQEDLAAVQRNAVVASYSLLAATGSLTVRSQGLEVAEYRAEVHYEAVKDKWFGLRTVDGK